ncbi:MAG: response regulator [Spirochaetales bacterium]|nr:response regulator [Spirochaetales bacterium]
MDKASDNLDKKNPPEKILEELENARRDLEVREDNLRKTISLIGYAVVYGDGDGLVTGMNEIARVLTEVHEGEEIGKSLSQLFTFYTLPSREALNDPFAEVKENGLVVSSNEDTLLVNREGREYHVEYSAAPNSYSGDEVTGMVIVLKDNTELHLHHEQMGQVQKMDVVGQLAGGIAHDFNNMLGGILGAAELLKKRVTGDDKALEYSDIIINATGRAAELTQELVSFATKQRSSSTFLDMHRIIEEGVKILKGTADPRVEIVLELNSPDSIVGGNQSQLQNIIMNIGTNAFHSMPAGGRFVIETSRFSADEDFCHKCPHSLKPGEYLRMDFSDTGCGIPPHLIKKIFEPFFTTKDKMKSSGLGLAAVYGIVKQHGGCIDVESTVARGSKFSVVLPLEEGQESAGMGSSDLIHGKGMVMVVDDEFVMRMTAKNILEELGYTVTLVENGRDAVNLFRAYGSNFDAVILDMVMPIMDGQECFEELIQIDPSVKVLLSTGLTGGDVIEEMKKKGLKGFISKPYLSYELSHRVYKIINE